MLLTTELDKLSGTDWQLFFAQESDESDIKTDPSNAHQQFKDIFF